MGDGRTPRTAALLAMRTRWTVLSVDPALEGLLPTAEAPAEAEAEAKAAAEAPAEAEAEAEAEAAAEGTKKGIVQLDAGVEVLRAFANKGIDSGAAVEEERVEAPSSERCAQAASRHGLTPNVPALTLTLTLTLTRAHVLPKELRHARLAAQQGSARQLARRARLRDELAQVRPNPKP